MDGTAQGQTPFAASADHDNEGFRDAAAALPFVAATSVFSSDAAGALAALFGPRDQPLPRLRAALRRERARGRSGHWSYDLSRHLALSRAVKRAEAAAKPGPFPL